MGENISGSTCGASHRAGRRSRKRHDGSARGGAWILRTFRRRAASRRQRLNTSYTATPRPIAYPPRTDNRADKHARGAHRQRSFARQECTQSNELRSKDAPSLVRLCMVLAW